MVLSILELVSIVMGVMSLVLGILSIAITFHFKKAADAVNQNTQALLIDVKSDSKAITNGVLKELKQWGDTGRATVSQMAENHTNNSVPSGFRPNESSEGRES